MNQELEIRDYRTSDHTKLIEILKSNVPKYFAASEIKDFQYYLENEIEQYFVIEHNGVIIGSGGINFANNNTIGRISWDLIDPKFQKMGVGRKLLQHRLEKLKAITTLESITVRTSQFVYQFYEKNGFVLQSIKHDYWAEGFDLYEMIYKKINQVGLRN